jgi:WD40 repeat protein
MMGVMVVSVAAGAACGEGPATQPATPKAVVLEQVAGPVYAGAFSKDGRVVVLGGKNGLFILDDKGRLVKQVGTSAAVGSLAISPDGQYVAAGLADKTVVLVTVADGVVWRTLDCEGLVMDIPAVAGFLPDSRMVVAGGSAVGVWSVGDGVLQRRFVLPVQQNRMALSPDGKVLATGWTAGGAITLVDMANGRPLARQPEVKKETLESGPQNPRGVDFLRFTADGRHVYGGGYLSGGLFFYNTADGKQVGELMFDHFSRGALTDDLAAVAWGTWDGAGATPGMAAAAATAPGGAVKNAVTVTLTANRKDLMRSEVGAGVGLVLLSGDGRTLIAGLADGRVLMWTLGR